MEYSLPKAAGLLQEPMSYESAELYARYKRLTMPEGALDSLMKPALQILAQRKTTSTAPLQVGFVLCAGDHSVARKHGVSAYPSEVTPQMVANIVSGGAAISRLAGRRGAQMIVCDVGVAAGFDQYLSGPSAQNIFLKRANLHHAFPHEGYEMGARDITSLSALSEQAHAHCWAAGAQCVDDLLKRQPCDVIALGEMGIGNTTAASAIASFVTGIPVDQCAGRGTGLDDHGLQRKRVVIRKAIERVYSVVADDSPRTLAWAHSVLQELGGAELSALAGAAWRAAERGVMVLLDGAIVTAAIAPLSIAESTFRRWFIASHESAEQAHAAMLVRLDLQPLLKLGLRLGEGSGAALAVGLLQDADELLRTMATFESAGVSSS